MVDETRIPEMAVDYAAYIRRTRDPSTWAADCQQLAEEFRRLMVRELGEDAQVGRAHPKPKKEKPPTPDAYRCEGCGEVFTHEAAKEHGPRYECYSCGAEFTREDNADGDPCRCPQCNDFGSKIAEVSCPEGCTNELTPLFAQ